MILNKKLDDLRTEGFNVEVKIGAIRHFFNQEKIVISWE